MMGVAREPVVCGVRSRSIIQNRFNFNDAVHIIKQHPLSTWMHMQNAITEEMRNDLVDGYCICKVAAHAACAQWSGASHIL